MPRDDFLLSDIFHLAEPPRLTCRCGKSLQHRLVAYGALAVCTDCALRWTWIHNETAWKAEPR